MEKIGKLVFLYFRTEGAARAIMLACLAESRHLKTQSMKVSTKSVIVNAEGKEKWKNGKMEEWKTIFTICE